MTVSLTEQLWPEDLWKGTKVYRKYLGFENSFGVLSYADLRSQFLELDIQLRATAVKCTQSRLVGVLVIVVEGTIMTDRDRRAPQGTHVENAKGRQRKAFCGELGLEEGKETLALLSRKTVFT